jgi:hypothetical protein
MNCCLNKNKKNNISKTITLEVSEGEINPRDLSIEDTKLIYTALKKNQLKELATIHYAIENLSNTFIVNKKKHETHLQVMEHKLKEKYECSICIENTKNIVFIPCGHAFCKGCSGNTRECYLCRQPISFKQKMY